MTERLNNTIETQINDGNTIVSQIVDNNQPLQTVIQDVPQVQTVLQNGINVSSQINAPFVEVTSVNGKTGDVITEPVVGEFEPNHYYLKNTMIAYNNNLYYAKEAFTSGSSFNANDWYSVEGSQITVDSSLSTTSENPVQNKVITNALNGKNKTIYTAYNIAPAEDTPEAWKTTLGNNGVYITWYNTTKTFTNQPVQYGFMRTIIGANDIRQDFWAQTSGVHYARTGNYQGWSSYAGTTGVFKNLGAQPGNGTLTIQRNGTNVQTFTANQTGNATANISVPTKTSEIENDSDFLATEDLFTTKSGTNINFTENESTSLSSFSLKGNTSQQTYSGKNLLKMPIVSGSSNGITWTVQDDGSIILNGTSTAGVSIRANNVTIPAVEGETYTLSATGMGEAYNFGYKNSGSGANIFVVTSASPTTTAVVTSTMLSQANRLDMYIQSGKTFNNQRVTLQLELGSSASSFEPYVGGIPAPNPDYPQPIQTVTGEQTVTVMGKNLFDGETVNAWLRPDGLAQSSQNDRTSADYIAVQPNATYTLHGTLSTYLKFTQFDGSRTAISQQTTTSATRLTVTTEATTAFVRIGWGNAKTASDVMLELGSATSDYVPYSHQTLPLDLGTIELCKLGTFQDSIYKSGDKWYVRKECGKVVVDGSEAGWLISASTGSPDYYYARTNALDGEAVANYYGGYNNAFKNHGTFIQGANVVNTDEYSFGSPSYSLRFLILGSRLSAMTTAALATFLAANKPTIYYALATPTDTEITNEALVGQLETILSQGSTYAGTNNITTVISAGNEQGELEITYPKFFSKIATTSSLGSIRVGEGLNITPEGTLSTQLGFTTESTSENTKIIELQDGTTTSYPITTKEAILGLKTYDASWLYDLIYDSTAFTSEQVSELREAILNKDDILIYDGDPTSPTGQTSYYRPVLASTSNTLEFLGLLNISFITAGPNMYSYSFMTTDQGETWSLNANSGGAFLATKYKAGSSFYYATPSSGCSIMLPGILTTSGTAGKFSINLGAPIIASNVTINTFKGNIRTSTGGYWINTGYVDGGQDYLNTSGVTITAGIDGNQVNFLLTRSSAQSGTTNNTPMTMELNALSLTFS